jgi:hypothetical protein
MIAGSVREEDYPLKEKPVPAPRTSQGALLLGREVHGEHRTIELPGKWPGKNNPRLCSPGQLFENYPGEFMMSMSGFRVGRAVDLGLLSQITFECRFTCLDLPWLVLVTTVRPDLTMPF